MITKERLEELIKEGATIYCLGGGKHKLTEDDFVSRLEGEDALMSFDNLGFYENVDYLKNFFETEEQAEWELNYHATRTEELDLPMWEELPLVFEKSFVTKNSAYYLSSSKPQDDISLIKYKNIMLFPCLDMGLEQIYVGRLTEENYIKACDLCLKLFKGEE